MADEDDNDLLSPEEREILADPEYGKAEEAAEGAADEVKSKERTIPLDEIDEDGDPIVSDGEDAPPPDTPAEIAAPAPEKDDPAPAEDATLAAAQKAYEAASAAAKAVQRRGQVSRRYHQDRERGPAREVRRRRDDRRRVQRGDQEARSRGPGA